VVIGPLEVVVVVGTPSTELEYATGELVGATTDEVDWASHLVQTVFVVVKRRVDVDVEI